MFVKAAAFDFDTLDASERAFYYKRIFPTSGVSSNGKPVSDSVRHDQILAYLATPGGIAALMMSIRSDSSIAPQSVSPFNVDDVLCRAQVEVESSDMEKKDVISVVSKTVADKIVTIEVKRVTGIPIVDAPELKKMIPEIKTLKYCEYTANLCFYIGCYTHLKAGKIKESVGRVELEKFYSKGNVDGESVRLLVVQLEKYHVNEKFVSTSMSGLEWAHFNYNKIMSIPNAMERKTFVFMMTKAIISIDRQIKIMRPLPQVFYDTCIKSGFQDFDPILYRQVEWKDPEYDYELEPTALQVQSCLIMSRKFRGVDAKSMSGMTASCYDGSMMSKTYAGYQAQFSTLTALSGTNLKYLVKCSDTMRAMTLSATFSRENSSNQLPSCDGCSLHIFGTKTQVKGAVTSVHMPANLRGYVFVEIDPGSHSEKSKTVSWEQYNKAITNDHVANVAQYAGLEPSAMIFNARMIEFNFVGDPVVETNYNRYFSASSRPHNMTVNVLYIRKEFDTFACIDDEQNVKYKEWLFSVKADDLIKPEIVYDCEKKIVKSNFNFFVTHEIDLGEFFKSVYFSNVYRNTYCDHRMPIRQCLKTLELPYPSLVTPCVAGTVVVDNVEDYNKYLGGDVAIEFSDEFVQLLEKPQSPSVDVNGLEIVLDKKPRKPKVVAAVQPNVSSDTAQDINNLLSYE
jgi:hypothetical protein